MRRARLAIVSHLTHIAVESVKRGEQIDRAVRSEPVRVQTERMAMVRWLQLVAMVLLAITVSAGAFLSFRSIARRFSLQHGHPGGERVWTGATASGALGASNPPPSRDGVIAEVLAWEPPLASGKATPLDRAAALPIASADHVLGSHLAPITLMLFGDLQCGYALHSLRVLIERVQREPAEYRLVWRERPLANQPNAAALAVEAERLSSQHGEVSFWRYVRALSRLEQPATAADASAIANALRTRPPKVSDAVATENAFKQLQSDEQIAAAYAIRESPTLFVNGLRVDGDPTETDLDEIIEEERDAIQQLEQDSIPRAKFYATRVHENLLDLQLD